VALIQRENFYSFNFAGTSGSSHTGGSRENSRPHAGTDTADAQEYPENDRREKKVRVFYIILDQRCGSGLFLTPKTCFHALGNVTRVVHPGY